MSPTEMRDVRRSVLRLRGASVLRWADPPHRLGDGGRSGRVRTSLVSPELGLSESLSLAVPRMSSVNVYRLLAESGS